MFSFSHLSSAEFLQTERVGEIGEEEKEGGKEEEMKGKLFRRINLWIRMWTYIILIIFIQFSAGVVWGNISLPSTQQVAFLQT